MANEITLQDKLGLGGEFHDDWRAPRKLVTGGYDPRWKATTDAKWAGERKEGEPCYRKAGNGVPEVDIANLDFARLPEDWQLDNMVAAEHSLLKVDEAVKAGIPLDEGFIETASAYLHNDVWVPMHGKEEWAVKSGVNQTYDKIPDAEKEKDRVKIRKAIEYRSRQ